MAAGGGRERRSRPGREGGGRGSLPEAQAQQAGVQLGSGAAGPWGPNGKQWGPCIREQPLSKKGLGPKDRQSRGDRAWKDAGSPSLCFPVLTLSLSVCPS